MWRETVAMKCFIFLVLCLASSQGLFLRHFQNKWDTIRGWWSSQEEPQPQVAETLRDINQPERQYKDETSYYYDTTSSITTTTSLDITTPSTPSNSSTNPNDKSTVNGRSRKPRCRTVDSRVGHCNVVLLFS